MARTAPVKRIPITAAKRIADVYGQRQVILATWGDDGICHFVSYGITKKDCGEAAQGSRAWQRHLGFEAPE